jgi:hypothetical protein
MALTPEQRLSILDAGTRLQAKGKLLNLDLRRMARNAAPPSKPARDDAATFSRTQPAPSASVPPAKPRTPNATG